MFPERRPDRRIAALYRDLAQQRGHFGKAETAHRKMARMLKAYAKRRDFTEEERAALRTIVALCRKKTKSARNAMAMIDYDEDMLGNMV